MSSGADGVVVSVLGGVGRQAIALFDSSVAMAAHAGAIGILLAQCGNDALLAPLRGRLRFKGQLMPMMRNVGVRSLPVVLVVSLLTGIILILQTGDVLADYGRIAELPGVVALSLTRELVPLMTGVVLTARVGASFTAVLASMQINEEVTALRTMAIDPVAWLAAPRLLSMLVMVPCLTVLGFFAGISGGAVVANAVYDLPYALYVEKTGTYLEMTDILAGVAKAIVFGVVISGICCHYGFTARGGATGLGRYVMLSVVTAIVVIIIADALLTAFFVTHVW